VYMVSLGFKVEKMYMVGSGFSVGNMWFAFADD
jgi:hypothetical protein